MFKPNLLIIFIELPVIAYILNNKVLHNDLPRAQPTDSLLILGHCAEQFQANYGFNCLKNYRNNTANS